MEEVGVDVFIDGEKIALIALNLERVSLYCKWSNDPVCRKYLRNIIPKTIEEFKKLLEPMKGVNQIVFNIYYKSDKKVIGSIGLNLINWFNRNAKIFYIIGEREYWGHGLATEAVLLILNYAFQELNLHMIYACVMIPNIASIRVLEKLGFTLEGTFREESYIDGMYHDTKRYSILKNEWLSTESK